MLKVELPIRGYISGAFPRSVQGRVKIFECCCVCSEYLCSYSASMAIQRTRGLGLGQVRLHELGLQLQACTLFQLEQLSFCYYYGLQPQVRMFLKGIKSYGSDRLYSAFRYKPSFWLCFCNSEKPVRINKLGSWEMWLKAPEIFWLL